ncbi:hypothetical protein EGJ86_22215 [Pseudomonas sp. o96-267]|uniref:hypothetical protein n=1 Tax=Pseudomonas sp. o96-267 TaxID=2479853 RepID=UPI000F7BA340|nr:MULTISPECIES: hypothetical protein [Pseudomonas]MDH0960915.1 hypothetical protein [Pseudomonas chengduensis]MDV5863667.1 hypothetical protein [Pseudomonas mendocina]RRV29957.1 hypothetical protein EGJ86_22215 [Pseudomonas sp. o96-267]
MKKTDVIEAEYEVEASRVIIDPRSFGQRCWDNLQHPRNPMIWAVISGLVTIVWSGFIPFAVFVFFILWLATATKPDVLPIHLPMDANKIDPNDAKPGGKAFYKARGSFYIGRSRNTGFELWASFKALTQHFLIFGTTGAGKTESIVSYIVNYLSVGSAVSFQDAKAAPKAMFQIATFCRIFGRDDDFRVTNYITGQTSASRDPAERMSNDAAVFASGNAESNTQLLVSLMPPSQGDNKIFSERAVALIAAVMPALTNLRDQDILQIDPGVIRRYMSFKQFVAVFRNSAIRKASRDALQAYLESLPGYDENKAVADQPEEVTRQFGFAQAYFTRSLASLSDTYGHIYMVGQGEIDYQDAVLNGRMLMTLLPSLEKSGEELANLGKIVLTATRNGMVVGLGTVFEGSAEDVVHNLPTNSEIPYGVMNDENAYMLVEGQEMINAQARGLGFGVLTGTQDAPGMLENISKTTKQIMANSAFKQIMYLDDSETTKLAIEFSGEANVMVRNSYERDGDLGNYYAGKTATMEKRSRLTASAIKQQGLGQAYLMYQGKTHTVQVFNHGISEKHKNPTHRYVSHWYPVRMAKVRMPNEEALNELIALSPRPEWINLKIMIGDNARALLHEMSTFFGSQLQIRRITEYHQKNKSSEMTAITKEVYGNQVDLKKEVVIEESSGLMRTIEDSSPKSFMDALGILVSILKTGKSEQVRLQSYGDEARLDDFASLFDANEDDRDDSGRTSGGSGAAGGSMPRSAAPATPAPAVVEDDILSGYMSGDFDPADDRPGVSDPVEADEPVVIQSAPERPKSAMASVVERNLAHMPWMASAVEYEATQSALVQTEMYFNDGDASQAQAAVEQVMDSIASQLQYPTTSMADSLLSTDQIKGAMALLVGNNRPAS